MKISASFIFGLLLLTVACAAQPSDKSASLVVATYNAMNLTGRHGVGLFPERSYARSERDFLAIRKYLLATNADVILLQEVGDLKALSETLPTRYSYILDPKYKIAESGQIYTAVAFDESRVRVAGVSVIPTGLEYDDSGVRVRLRDSLGVRLRTNIGVVWVYSIHLKSSCGQKGLSHGVDSNPCVLLEKQLRILASYVDEMRDSGDFIIVGGDFNRRGQPNYQDDAYLSIVQPKTAKAVLAKIDSRACPTFEGKDYAPIDFFLTYGMENVSIDITELVFHQGDIDAGFKLSDHCPVIARFRPSLP